MAPITNKEDAEAIYKTIKMGQHEGCPFYQGVNKYSIGLKVTACGKGKQERIFSNGVVWNETLHASLYSDRIDSWNQPCVYAQFNSRYDRPQMASSRPLCYERMLRPLCLKPAVPVEAACSDFCSKTDSVALRSSKPSNDYFSIGIIGFLALVAALLTFLATTYYKKYRSVKDKHARLSKNICF